MNFWFILIQAVWGFPQTITGAILALYLKYRKHKIERYYYDFVLHWKLKGSMSLGPFIFIGEEDPQHRIRTHEYGHSIQSLILGPLFLILIGVPSIVWAGFPPFNKYREKHHYSYYRFFTEKFANYLGEKYTDNSCPV